jgi:hypothetical protein
METTCTQLPFCRIAPSTQPAGDISHVTKATARSRRRRAVRNHFRSPAQVVRRPRAVRATAARKPHVYRPPITRFKKSRGHPDRFGADPGRIVRAGVRLGAPSGAEGGQEYGDSDESYARACREGSCIRRMPHGLRARRRAGHRRRRAAPALDLAGRGRVACQRAFLCAADTAAGTGAALRATMLAEDERAVPPFQADDVRALARHERAVAVRFALGRARRAAATHTRHG